ncbi:MAG TPA: hypothetical protein VKE51_26395 [Vicinamibacterales bacterium]|nr:hypothetical protein [Vicinamibacterales bacterium]
MSRILARFALAVLAAVAVSAVAAGQSSIPGLEMKVTKIDRAASASLRDCPPGTNTVNAVSKPGEQFALVTVSFKVSSAYKPAPMKRPTVTDSNDKSYFTPSQFVDVGSIPEFSCTFPFRVPDGTKLKALKIESASLDLAAMDK